jgi:hypothetical protein
MFDEGTLRERFPEIAWDQPVKLTIPGEFTGWACRYCVVMLGLRSIDVLSGEAAGVYPSRQHAYLHIERVHHD